MGFRRLVPKSVTLNDLERHNSLILRYFTPVCLVDVDVAGTGGVLVFSPSYVAVSQWFDKKKGKAMALSTLGTGLGSVCMAPLIAMLVDQYNYFGTMLIVGALLLNNAVGGALYRTPPEQPRRDTENAKEAEEERELSDKVIRDDILHRLINRGYFGILNIRIILTNLSLVFKN